MILFSCDEGLDVDHKDHDDLPGRAAHAPFEDPDTEQSL